eukprot:6185655-Pleurochrysis_carterae.AAC.3
MLRAAVSGLRAAAGANFLPAESRTPRGSAGRARAASASRRRRRRRRARAHRRRRTTAAAPRSRACARAAARQSEGAVAPAGSLTSTWRSSPARRRRRSEALHPSLPPRARRRARLPPHHHPHQHHRPRWTQRRSRCRRVRRRADRALCGCQTRRPTRPLRLRSSPSATTQAHAASVHEHVAQSSCIKVCTSQHTGCLVARAWRKVRIGGREANRALARARRCTTVRSGRQDTRSVRARRAARAIFGRPQRRADIVPRARRAVPAGSCCAGRALAARRRPRRPTRAGPPQRSEAASARTTRPASRACRSWARCRTPPAEACGAIRSKTSEAHQHGSRMRHSDSSLSSSDASESTCMQGKDPCDAGSGGPGEARGFFGSTSPAQYSAEALEGQRRRDEPDQSGT